MFKLCSSNVILAAVIPMLAVGQELCQEPRTASSALLQHGSNMRQEQLQAEQDGAGKVECKGITGYNQTCLIHHALYNPTSKAFEVLALQEQVMPDGLALDASGVPGAGGVSVNVVRFADEKAMQEYLKTKKVRRIPDVSLAHKALWHFNWAHGVFDSLYPGYVGLAKFGLHEEPYTPFISFDSSYCPGNPHEESMQDQHVACWVEDLWSRFGALGSQNKDLINWDKTQDWLLFDKLVVGGAAGGEYTANTELPGLHLVPGQSLLRLFANRMYRAYGLPEQKARSDSRNDRKSVLQVAIVDVEHFTDEDRQAQSEARNALSVLESQVSAVKEAVSLLSGSKDLHVEMIKWEDVQPFRKQLELMHDVDIFVAGPGTGQFYSVFLQDGAAQVSLGARYTDPDAEAFGVFPSFREEMIPGSNNHIKAFFMDLQKVARGYAGTDVVQLVQRAASEIKQGFTIPISNPVDNLSPLGKIVSDLMGQSSESRYGLSGFQSTDAGFACHQRFTGQTAVADIVFELRQTVLQACKVDLTLLRQLKRKYELDKVFGNNSCDCIVCPSCGALLGLNVTS